MRQKKGVKAEFSSGGGVGGFCKRPIRRKKKIVWRPTWPLRFDEERASQLGESAVRGRTDKVPGTLASTQPAGTLLEASKPGMLITSGPGATRTGTDRCSPSPAHSHHLLSLRGTVRLSENKAGGGNRRKRKILGEGKHFEEGPADTTTDELKPTGGNGKT